MPPVTAIVFMLIFIAGCAAALFADAAYGIFLYVFAYFLDPHGRWWGASLPDMRYAFIIGIFALIGYLIRTRSYSQNRIFSAPQTKWLLLIGLLMISISPIAVAADEHQKFLVIFIKYIMLYVLIIKVIDTPDKFEKLIWIFLSGQFYLGWIAREMGRSGEGRLERLAGPDCKDANGSAALMIVSVPFVVNYLITGKKWQKICALPMLAFILNALILINSRGALIGLTVAMAYYFFMSLKSPSFPKFNKAKVVAVVFVGVALFMYLTDTLFLERMGTLSSEEDNGQSSYTGRERTAFWMKTFDMVRDHPLGAGVEGYDFLSPHYLPRESLSANGRRAVHSLYFQVLAEYGYIGFAFFILFLLASFKYLRKLRAHLIQMKVYEPYHMALALEAGFLSFLVASIFISTFYMEIMYWMAAFFAAFGNIYFREAERVGENVSNSAEHDILSTPRLSQRGI